MAILIDPPVWPAHGTVWSHLVSDSDLNELHDFAHRLGVPRRGFDLDHYDVPASLFERAIEAGALAVSAKEVVYALQASGLRVKGVDRAAAYPLQRMAYLRTEWRRLGEQLGPFSPASSASSAWAAVLSAPQPWLTLGEELLARWAEPHRTYHDVRHLEDVLLALNQLEVRGEEIAVETLLAAWFHDAVYDGVAGDDERASAQLALTALTEFGVGTLLAQTVHDLVIATTPAQAPHPVTRALAHLLDADLAIFAASQARYDSYAAAVRLEYAHVPNAQFAAGRSQILEAYAKQPAIYRTEIAYGLWEKPARANLKREIASLRAAC